MPIIKPGHQPKFSWEALRVDDDLGTVSGVVTEGAVLAHAFSIGENADMFTQGLPGIGPFVPPSLLVNDLLKLFLVGYDCTEFGTGGGLHTRALITNHAPLPIGADVSITGKHVAKFIRKGRHHRSVLTEVRASGKLIAEMLATETVGYTNDHGPDEGQPPENWAGALPIVTTGRPANAPTAVAGQPVGAGTVLGPVRRWVGLEQSVLFSGFPFSWAQERGNMRQGLHTNFDLARKAGYSMPVVQGLMSASHLTSLLLRQYGARFFDDSQLALNFVAPLLAETWLNSQAVAIESPQADGRTVDLMSLVSYDDTGKIYTAGYGKVPR